MIYIHPTFWHWLACWCAVNRIFWPLYLCILGFPYVHRFAFSCPGISFPPRDYGGAWCSDRVRARPLREKVCCFCPSHFWAVIFLLKITAILNLVSFLCCYRWRHYRRRYWSAVQTLLIIRLPYSELCDTSFDLFQVQPQFISCSLNKFHI